MKSPSWVASEEGSESSNEVPLPLSVEIEIFPLRRSVSVLTTSSPTPRPESSEIVSFVENPDSNRNWSKSFCCILEISFARSGYFEIAFFWILEKSIPRPSSLTVTKILLEFCVTEIETLPFLDFFAFFRSCGVSIPWSIAFLTRWIKIFGSFSRIDLSIVISEWGISNSTFLFNFNDSSAIECFKGIKIISKGSILSEIIFSWMSKVCFSITSMLSVTSRKLRFEISLCSFSCSISFLSLIWRIISLSKYWRIELICEMLIFIVSESWKVKFSSEGESWFSRGKKFVV